MTKARSTPIAIFALTLSLSACDFRQEDGEEPDPAETAESPAAVDESPPEPAQQTPPISIIREDVMPQTVIELPPEPLEVIVPFAEGGTEISEEAERVLSGVLASDALDEDWPVILRGHTDSSGDDRANLRASRARAEAVAAWLVERGVEDERVEVIAFGEQNPIAPNALPSGEPNERGRARNRRVEIEIAPADETEAAGDERRPASGNDRDDNAGA